MPRIKLTLQYDGSRYHGFQIQNNAITIQQCLMEEIVRLTGEAVKLQSAGRTDTGVHALGQVVAFNTSSTIPASKWSAALNSYLPKDIQVLESCQVNADFHPRYDAVQKNYTYLIYRQQPGRVCLQNYAWCNQEPLDIEQMQRACHLITGRQNYKSFCASGADTKTYERTISRCELLAAHQYLTLEISAEGFLYHMVRIIMGTLMEIGRHKIDLEDLAGIIAAQDRNQAGPTVPPQGLYLVSVDYHQHQTAPSGKVMKMVENAVFS